MCERQEGTEAAREAAKEAPSEAWRVTGRVENGGGEALPEDAGRVTGGNSRCVLVEPAR